MSYVASGVTGASPIWQDIMKFTLKDLPTSGPYKPKEGIDGASVCSDSGILPAADNPCPTRYEYFIKGTVSTVSSISRKEIWINKDTHHPPATPEEFANVELQEHLIASDRFSKEYCLDCEPYPEGMKPTHAATYFPYTSGAQNEADEEN